MNPHALNPLFPPPRPRLGDVVAGIAVALVLIPQSLAYAEIAGVPPQYGLFAAALPPIAAALAASSPYLQTGPVAMTALLSFGALSGLAVPGSGEFIGLAALLALVVGVTRAVIGLVGAGNISYFLSRPVLSAFTSAAAILIVASQIPTALGVSPPEGKLLWRAGWALGHPDGWHLASLVLAAVAATAVLGGKRIHTLFPGVALAVATGLIVAGSTEFGGPTIGDLPNGFPALSLSLPWSRVGELLVPGVVIALVGFAEAASISLTFAARDRTRWEPDREFIGQGLANLAAGLTGGFPVGGSFSRSAINRASGARTRWSGAITGIAVLAFLPAVGVLEPLPRSILAGIVIAAVVRLIRLGDLVTIFRYSPAQGSIAIATFVLTLALAPRIDQAVLIGIGMGVVIHLVRELRVEIDADVDGETLTIRPAGVLFFGSAHTLSDLFLGHLAANPQATRLVIDIGGVGRLDYTGAMTLRGLRYRAEDAGLHVELVGITRTTKRIINSVWHDKPPGFPWRRLLGR